MSEISRQFEKPRMAIGGGVRIAPIFVPAYNSAVAIKLPVVRRPRRALARRELARVIEPRRVVS